MRPGVRDMVEGMLRRNVAPRMILVAVTREQPASRLRLATIEEIRKEIRAENPK